MLDYQGEAAELEGENETRPGDELQAVLEATGNIDLNGGSQHESETMTDEGDNTILQTEPSKKIQVMLSNMTYQNGQRRRKISQVRVMLPPIPQKWNKNQKQPVRPVTKGIHKTWITP